MDLGAEREGRLLSGLAPQFLRLAFIPELPATESCCSNTDELNTVSQIVASSLGHIFDVIGQGGGRGLHRARKECLG